MVRPGHVRAPSPVIRVPPIAIHIVLSRVNAERLMTIVTYNFDWSENNAIKLK